MLIGLYSCCITTYYNIMQLQSLQFFQKTVCNHDHDHRMPCFSHILCLNTALSFPSPLQCSVTCGRGTKQREVACVYQNQTKIEEEHCSHLPRPRTQKACRARGCPTWKANRWKEVCFFCTRNLSWFTK